MVMSAGNRGKGTDNDLKVQIQRIDSQITDRQTDRQTDR
jgi:hypothetical protein